MFELFRKAHGLPPDEAWVIATNKSFSLMGGSKLRAFGDPFAANVVLPKQLLIETIKSAVSTDAGPGVEDRQALAERMMVALDDGYEGFGWKVYESGRGLGSELKASLAKSLLAYFNDPAAPTSGDELTFFMTKEIMNRFAPSLLVVNFWDIDIAHYGAYSLYLEAIRRTDRLVHELWQHAQLSPAYRDRTTMIVVPEMGRDSDVAGNGFANHRALLEHLSHLPKRELDRAVTGIARIEADGGVNRVGERNAAKFQDAAQALLRQRGLNVAWRGEVDAFFQKID